MIQRDNAVLILYNSKGEVLLQHRSKDAKRRPNYWGFFGGGIEKGETPREALEREIKEELDYQVVDPQVFTVGTYTLEQTDGETIIGTRNVFIEKYDDKQELHLHEGQGMGWFKPDDTAELLLSDKAREDLSSVEKYIQSL